MILNKITYEITDNDIVTQKIENIWKSLELTKNLNLKDFENLSYHELSVNINLFR